MTEQTPKLALFEGKKVRNVMHEGMLYFSVIDVIEVLTNSSNPRDYWYKMKIRVKTEEETELSTNCLQLKLLSSDGKLYATDCANTETLFRIIQSIPSPKAEPFKRWLAKVGYERIQEIEDPELTQQRAREIYKAKGYSEGWIEKRMRGIQVREELTNEWKERGVGASREFAILTAEISKATFGMTPSEYKDFKGLAKPNENLRDHMTDLELIFSMLGEAATTEIARNTDAQGFNQNKTAAKKGGKVAGDARKDLEKQSAKKISTKKNFKHLDGKPEPKEIAPDDTNEVQREPNN
jgi:DNA-damage-inducible protein D